MNNLRNQDERNPPAVNKNITLLRRLCMLHRWAPKIPSCRNSRRVWWSGTSVNTEGFTTSTQLDACLMANINSIYPQIMFLCMVHTDSSQKRVATMSGPVPTLSGGALLFW